MNFLFILLLPCLSFAGLLTKAKDVGKYEKELSGFHVYELLSDAYTFTEGELKGKTIFFTSRRVEGKEKFPVFVIGENGKVLDKKPLPHLEEGWNLTQVMAVSAVKRDDGTVIVYSILKLEPLSGRSSDYWDQAFIFKVTSPGKIESIEPLNKELSEDLKIKTIKALKAWASKKKIP